MKIFFTLAILLLTASVSTQTYWQQEVNYKITVKLNDVDHSLSAFESFEYVNNSPSTLDFIYIHVWPNAYRNGNTALAKQQYKGGETILKYGDQKLKGAIDSLDFKADGQTVVWEFDKINIDIVKLNLNKSLNPGERVTISTPFKVTIPSGEISRLGHVGQSYQITQWYPKPAVYDKNGWNQMPYLNQGEFYSEFGSFDVSITLPKNYVVGATGDLQTKSELDFLNQKVEESKSFIPSIDKFRSKKDSFPASSDEFKTIRYIQSKVHDFAWFADKRFLVKKGEVEMPRSKRKVTSWAMYTPKNAKIWENAIEYINDGTYYYSKWNGDYPYNQVTAIDGTISAGGGMEYPNVTVIGNTGNAMALEVVIVHEVGHNWFYGILGTNERVHGWMDEGMNTLNEVRYVQTKYPDNTEMSNMVLGGKFHLNDLDHHDMGDISYRLVSVLGEDQPIETHSADFTSGNYGFIMYQKTGLVFHYLKEFLGDEKFDKAMNDYFETWKFKHPQPEDMRSSLEKSTGENLSWLFEDLIKTTNHIDYKIKSVKRSSSGTSVKVKNCGQVDGPIPVTLWDGKDKQTLWALPNGKRSRNLDFSMTNPQEIVIDENKQIPEIKRTNNSWKKSWLFNKKEPIRYEFLFGDHERASTNHFWTPMIGGNNGDKFMLGIVSHNLGIPFKPFQYLVAPMFSFGRKNIAGIGEFSYSFLPKRGVKLFKIGTSIKSFAVTESSYYAAVSPYLYFKLGNRTKAKAFSHNLLLQGIYRYDEARSELSFPVVGFNPLSHSNRAGAFVKYNFSIKKPDWELEGTFRTDYFDNLENNENLLRSNIESTFRLKYLKNKMERWIEVRAFAGKYFMLNNLTNAYGGVDDQYQYAIAGTSGSQDLFLEEYFFDRNYHFLNTVRMENVGGFKSTNSGVRTSTWLATTNIFMQLPIKPNIFGIFADFGTINNSILKQNEFIYNTGIGVRLGKVFGIYFPILTSKSISSGEYVNRIRMTLKLNIVNKPLSLSGVL
jgi:hypothetical protein